MVRKLKPPMKMFYVTDEENKPIAIGIAYTEEEFEERLQYQIPDFLDDDNYYIDEIDGVWRYNELAEKEGMIEITPPDKLEDYYEG